MLSRLCCSFSLFIEFLNRNVIHNMSTRFSSRSYWLRENCKVRCMLVEWAQRRVPVFRTSEKISSSCVASHITVTMCICLCRSQGKAFPGGARLHETVAADACRGCQPCFHFPGGPSCSADHEQVWRGEKNGALGSYLKVHMISDAKKWGDISRSLREARTFGMAN